MNPSNSLSAHVTLDTIQQLSCLRISNESASATLMLQGAHLIEYAPVGRENLLFVSNNEPFQLGKAIRGGIPICWPWFSAHAQLSDAPSHGFARTSIWQYEVISDSSERTDIRLTLETDGDREDFPYKARVELLVSIGQSLIMSLTTTNLTDTPFALSQALHSYFATPEANNVRLSGLVDYPVYDKVNQKKLAFPSDFVINREIDWVVLDEGQPILLTGVSVPCRLTRLGSRSLVVWNPWQEKAKTLSQFHPEEYQRMVCIEPANTGDDTRLIKPKQSHSLIFEVAPLTSQ